MTDTASDVGAPVAAPSLGETLDEYRRELTGFAYQMLGSPFDAEDAVQETLIRAVRAHDRFEGRSSLRTWLYRIVSNVCIDMRRSSGRRALPYDLSETPSAPVLDSLGEPRGAETWVEPIPDAAVDPGEQAVTRDSVRLAFITALQTLPPRQRAVLILRDVLSWKAAEVAGLLDTTVASVNSALQRARATLAARKDDHGDAPDPVNADDAALLARYVDAFQRYDIDALVSLLHEDATQCMPPFALWLEGPADIAAWHLGPGHECRGSRLVPLRANGQTGFAQYRQGSEPGRYVAWSVQLLQVREGRISSINGFLNTDLFGVFGLPTEATAAALDVLESAQPG